MTGWDGRTGHAHAEPVDVAALAARARLRLERWQVRLVAALERRHARAAERARLEQVIVDGRPLEAAEAYLARHARSSR